MIRLPRGGAVGEVFHVDVLVVEAGDLFEGFAAGVQEVFLTFFADLLDGLEAVGGEGRAHHEEVLHAFGGKGFEAFVGVGRDPLLRAEARLERHLELVRREARALGEEQGGLHALVLVAVGVRGAGLEAAVLDLGAMGLGGVALAQVSLGNAVVGEQDLVEGLAEPRLGGLDEAVDVGRIVEVGLEDVILQVRRETGELLLDLHHDGLIRGHRVVRVLRHHEEVVDAVLEDFLDGFGAGRRAVAHAGDDGQAGGDFELLAELLGRDEERGAFGGPDGRVGGGGLLRAGAQDDAFEQREAEDGGIIDHALVAEELAEVFPDVGHRGAFRRTEIEEQDAFASHGHRRKR